MAMWRKNRRRNRTAQTPEQLEQRVLLDATGLFAVPADVEIPNQNGHQVLLGDMDGDGDLDAVLISANAQSQIFVNDGAGNFEPTSPLFGPLAPTEAAIADFDGDSNLDVAIGDGNPNGIAIWRNLGNYQFEKGEVFAASSTAHSVNAADLDGDGDTDVAWGGNGQHFLTNDGHGQFNSSSGRSIGASVLTNFDGDKDIDLLGNRVFLANDGTGQFPLSVSTAISVAPLVTSIADFDGDGDDDVYESNRRLTDGNGHIWFNEGTGRFTDSGQILGRKSDGQEDIDTTVGDVDGDGDLDLVVAHNWDPVTYLGSTIWLNDGTGHFTRETGPLLFPLSIALGDVDADGDLDLVAENVGDLNVSLNRTVTTMDLPSGGGNFEVIRSGSDLIVRHVGGEEIYRGGAADVRVLRIQGSSGNDRVDASTLTGIKLVMNGGDGNDTLIGGSNADTIQGGHGNDSLVGNDGADQMLGDAGNDVLNGNLGNDRLDGGDEADTLLGGAGGDELRGGLGDDVLNGGSGHDRLSGDAGSDVLRGDSGNDVLEGGSESDTLVGDDGHDSLLGGDGDDLLRGGLGRDTLDGDTGHDDLRGGADNDSLNGGLGNDTLNGNVGNNTLIGGYGDDALAGGLGHDQLLGNAGRDTLLGGSGNDSLYGGADADILLGADGDDSLDGQGHSRDTLNGGSGTNVVLGLANEIDLAFVLMPDWRDRS